MKIAYIDSKFIYHICEGSEMLIIFQKPMSASKEQVEQAFFKIEELVKKEGINISPSDIVKHVNDSAFDESITRTLFIHIENQGNFITQDLLLTTFGNGTIELSTNKETIAKITFRKHNYTLKVIMIIAVLSVLSVLFYVYNDNKRNNEKRIAQNISLYKSDLQRIQILEKKYNEAINEKKIYIRFLQQEHSASIQSYISSLKDVAYQRFENVREDGEYYQLVFNEDSINTEIKKLVSDAEECIKKEDNERRLSNTKSFSENLNAVDELLKYIDEKKLKSERYKSHIDQKALSDIADAEAFSRLSDIEKTISQIKNDINSRFEDVKECGIYTPINIKKTEYKEAIDSIFEEAFNKYKATKKTIKSNKRNTPKNPKQKRSLKVTTPSPQKRRASSERNLTRQSYMDLVRQADQDYKSFFYSNKNDKGAAQRAIMKYQKAQRMTFDSKIDVRIKKLQKEIQ